MKKVKHLVLAVLASISMAFAIPQAAYATSSCGISGALQATWGCGRVYSATQYTVGKYNGYSTRIQDMDSDGSCVYIYIHTIWNNTWSYTGDRECNEVPTTYNRSNLPLFDGIRIYRFSSQGNNYKTLF